MLKSDPRIASTENDGQNRGGGSLCSVLLGRGGGVELDTLRPFIK